MSAAGIDFIQINQIKENFVAVGDYYSCVHLLQIPNSLYVKTKNEKENMIEFLESEL